MYPCRLSAPRPKIALSWRKTEEAGKVAVASHLSSARETREGRKEKREQETGREREGERETTHTGYERQREKERRKQKRKE